MLLLKKINYVTLNSYDMLLKFLGKFCRVPQKTGRAYHKNLIGHSAYCVDYRINFVSSDLVLQHVSLITIYVLRDNSIVRACIFWTLVKRFHHSVTAVKCSKIMHYAVFVGFGFLEPKNKA